MKADDITCLKTARRRVSADLHNKCTNRHTGTSASAPLAAGIIALVLEANPDLTWRDVQHIVAYTSEYSCLRHNGGWKRNGAQFWVNSAFGFGLLNAVKLVELANPETWKTVPQKTICYVDSGNISNLPSKLASGQEVVVEMQTTGCKGGEAEINYLEHVEVSLSVKYSKRGDLACYLTSAMGTETMLLSERPRDVSTKGFKNWTFMSVHSWGEQPSGTWKVSFKDKKQGSNIGTIDTIRLTLHGTKDIPDHVRRAGGSRTYDDNYNDVMDERTPNDAGMNTMSEA
ncbi:hypothetical protein ScPMuIL_003637 [Solemya velum]